MSLQIAHCKTYRTSDRSEITSTLEQESLNTDFSHGILIGSRAARYYLPNFRGIRKDPNADYDIIVSSNVLLEWLREEDENIKTIDMIMPLSDDDKLDLYIYCTLNDGFKYDFIVPRSSTSYTAYIINNSQRWAKDSPRWPHRLGLKHEPYYIASSTLLLIFKKYMLYYPHQWKKTANDYRELLTITDPLTNDDMVLCDLLVQYNEKIHGKRPVNSNEFVISPTNTLNRNEFFQYTNNEQISLIYRVAMSLSFDNNILIGLKHICTQGPLWLADYVIENWIQIFQEKFKHKLQFSRPSITFKIENYRLFLDIPEIATQRILHFITNTTDFYSMQLVCKRWYTILHEEIFWRDLYISRYGAYSGSASNISSWKMLYLLRMEAKLKNDNNKLNQLVDASIQLRQYTVNDILQLWEDLTHQEQSIETVLMSKINFILSNSFYYQIEKTSEEYSVRLIIIGLENECSRSTVHLQLRVGEYGSSRFAPYTEQLSIEYKSSTNKKRSLTLLGAHLFGFRLQKWGYTSAEDTYLGQVPSAILDQYPSGLIICLFTMMVHPDHRAQFIKYLKRLEQHCVIHPSMY